MTAAATRHVRPKGAHSPALKPCVSHDVLERLGDKWTTSVVWLLAEMPGHRLRFSAIRNGIEGVTQRMLTVTLLGLERDGLVERHYFPEVPPRVEYELTDLGLGMFQALQEFAGWLSRSWPRIQEIRKDFDGAHRSNAKPFRLQQQGGLASVPLAVKTSSGSVRTKA